MKRPKKGSVVYFIDDRTYLFPAETHFFETDRRTQAKVPGRRTVMMSEFLIDQNKIDTQNCKIGHPITKEGAEILRSYSHIAEYCYANRQLKMADFDYATSYDLALCTFFLSKNESYEEKIIKNILDTLPNLINVFKRPVIHLKDEYIKMPVDAVKRINKETIRDFYRFPENWKTIDDDGEIIPGKLLTKVFNDDYSIYENRVFRDLIDRIFSFLSNKIRILSDIVAASHGIVKVDVLDGYNHAKYFLAIGKLYSAFIKIDNIDAMERMLAKTKSMYKQLKVFTNRKVYTKNTNTRPIAGRIHKTNIFAMHKDYKPIYQLYQNLYNTSEKKQDISYLEQTKSQLYYEMYCQMLSLFAASHFNFGCSPKSGLYKKGVFCVQLTFKNWELELRSVSLKKLDINGIVMTVKNKTSTKSVLLIPMSYQYINEKRTRYENMVQRLHVSGTVYDKYVFLEPFSSSFEDCGYEYSIAMHQEGLYYGIIPISVSDINSFRRIQKILFECMVQCGDADNCAFCDGTLVKGLGEKSTCKRCGMVIRRFECPNCGTDFWATAVSKKEELEDYTEELADFYKQEIQYAFRNITNMTESGFLCPCCGIENK